MHDQVGVFWLTLLYRVGQMMLCQAIMRHLIGCDQNLVRISQDVELSKHYRRVLELIGDNDTTEKGAFSIQNISKMGYAHGKIPGEWYGPHAIAIMLKVTTLILINILGPKQTVRPYQQLPNMYLP